MPVSLFALLLSLSARAHEERAAPLEVELSSREGALEAAVEADAEHWLTEVLGPEAAEEPWPGEVLARAQAYLASELRLSAGGAPLAGRLLKGRYARDPWDPVRGGRLRMSLSYGPAPREGAVSVRSSLPLSLSWPAAPRPVALEPGDPLEVPARELRPAALRRLGRGFLDGLASAGERPWAAFLLAASALLASRAGVAVFAAALLWRRPFSLPVSAGAAAAALLAWSAARLFTAIERRRAERVSESLAPRLLAGRRRFAAVLCACAGALSLLGGNR